MQLQGLSAINLQNFISLALRHLVSTEALSMSNILGVHIIFLKLTKTKNIQFLMSTFYYFLL